MKIRMGTLSDFYLEVHGLLKVAESEIGKAGHRPLLMPERASRELEDVCRAVAEWHGTRKMKEDAAKDAARRMIEREARKQEVENSAAEAGLELDIASNLYLTTQFMDGLVDLDQLRETLAAYCTRMR
jgi:hypothetical protein